MSSRDSTRFHELVNQQIANEFFGSHQYVATAVYFDAANMPQTARIFYEHALEERTHAMRFVQYLLNRGLDVDIRPIRAVVNTFGSPIEALQNAVDRELEVSDQIFALADVAERDADRFGLEFIQWYVREQIEEETLFRTLLEVAGSAGGDRFAFEQYVARDVDSKHAPGAPQIAGA